VAQDGGREGGGEGGGPHGHSSTSKKVVLPRFPSQELLLINFSSWAQQIRLDPKRVTEA
jgi:hypothetical protein